MASAELERTTIEIDAASPQGEAGLRATGTVIRFDGFLTLYQEGRDDEDDEEGGRLPPMAAGERLEREKIDATQHFTEPPPRYTEASLIKKMEELGIGRPSTYASTMETLRKREYVRLDRKRLVPEDKGRIVTAFLEDFFKRYVEFDFTADLEEKLDLISVRRALLEGRAARLLDGLRRQRHAGERGQPLAGDRRAERASRRPPLPRPRRRRRPARVPDLQGGQAFAEARQVRRLHRLLELSRVPLHAAARRERRGRGRRGRLSPEGTALGEDPATGLR